MLVTLFLLSFFFRTHSIWFRNHKFMYIDISMCKFNIYDKKRKIQKIIWTRIWYTRYSSAFHSSTLSLALICKEQTTSIQIEGGYRCVLHVVMNKNTKISVNRWFVKTPIGLDRMVAKAFRFGWYRVHLFNFTVKLNAVCQFWYHKTVSRFEMKNRNAKNQEKCVAARVTHTARTNIPSRYSGAFGKMFRVGGETDWATNCADGKIVRSDVRHPMSMRTTVHLRQKKSVRSEEQHSAATGFERNNTEWMNVWKKRG